MTATVVRIEGMDKLRAKFEAMADAVKAETASNALEAGATVIQMYAQDNIRTKLNKHPTGFLANSVTVKKEGKGVTVGPRNVVYAAIHEFGGTIVPLNAKMLHFMIDGKDVFAHAVRIPARPYLRPAVDAHIPEITQAIGDALRGLIGGAI